MSHRKSEYQCLWKKALVASLLCVGIFAAPPVRAGAWGESIEAALLLYNLEQIAEDVKGATLSIVKNAAIQTINQMVLGMVNGTLGQESLVIENWENFIYTQSIQEAGDVILYDFFPRMFSGKGSGSNYVPAIEEWNVDEEWRIIDEGRRIDNYPEYLSTIGKNTLEGLMSGSMRYSLDQDCSDPQAALGRGDYACFASIMEPQNNAYGLSILTEQRFAEEKAKKEKIAETQAGITGYKPQTNAQGYVVTPPQTISDIVSTMQTLPAMALAAAQNPAELVTGVIQIYVNSLIQKTLSNVGLGPVGASFANNLGNEMSRQSDYLMRQGVGSVFNTPGMGTDVVGPNNVGNRSSNPATSQGGGARCGTNCRYVD